MLVSFLKISVGILSQLLQWLDLSFAACWNTSNQDRGREGSSLKQITCIQQGVLCLCTSERILCKLYKSTLWRTKMGFQRLASFVIEENAFFLSRWIFLRKINKQKKNHLQKRSEFELFCLCSVVLYIPSVRGDYAWKRVLLCLFCFRLSIASN